MTESRSQPTTELRLGPLRLKGASALIAMVLLVAWIVWAIVRARPWEHPSPLWISGLLWVTYQIYWGAAAAKAAPSASAESAKSRALHTNLLTVGLLLLFVPVPGLRGRWLPVARRVAPVGLAVQALSLALMIWARRHLGRYWSGEISKKVGHELVRSGPYRWVRHPIYTGMLGMYLGTAIVAARFHALLGFVIAVFAYARKIPMEEKNLGELFGAQYDDYRKHSWALVPLVF